MPKKLFSEQDSCSGFLIKRITLLEDVRSIAYELFHMESGARLLYLQNDDKENLFSIAFKTPPYDDTGLPHILEHSVLCGSKRYPVKDPFVELLKTSVATFLNAITYPDKTIYPCASMNEEDFHNIMRVYCDAVFFPLLTESHFKQEGYHFTITGEPINKNSTLSVQGVVYNEMKGIYSDLDGIISREESKSIFPDNCYGKDSGGDPSAIPFLTYKKFKTFHSKYYHPSNSYIILYGSFNVKETLEILDREYLSKFTDKKVVPVIKKQKHWKKPVFKTITYPLEAGENTKKKDAVTINFFTNSLDDTLTSLAMSVLELYLLDNSSSPLRKALMDSQYGEELTSSGYADFQRDTFFTVGLKNINRKNVAKIVELVLSVCKKEAIQGLEQKRLDSVFHRLILDALEIQSSYPLVLMDRVYDYWIYDNDPLCMLQLNYHIEKLKNLRESKPEFFENLLMKYIVNNKHYSVLTFIPDTKYHYKIDKEQELKLEEIKNTFSKAGLIKIKKDSEYLKAFHEQHNSPEVLATLPRLSLSKIEKNIKIFKREFVYDKNRTLIFNDVFSNGINYLNLALGLKNIPDDLLDFLPVFKALFLKMGTNKYSYTEMAEREALYTGGVNSFLSSEGNFDDHQACCPYLIISSKSLGYNLENMLQIVFEKLHECVFSDTKRLREVILQRRTALRGSIVSLGSFYATSFASQKISKNLWLSEKFAGITHIRFLNNLADNFGKKQELIINKMNLIKKYILENSSLNLSFTGNNNQKKIIDTWSQKMASSVTFVSGTKNAHFSKNILRSGIVVPAAVAYNAGVFETVSSSNENASALMFIGNFLTYNYLWNEIRVKGGAYGANANYSSLNGVFCFSTYRDPHLKESFEIFKNSLKVLERSLTSKEQLEQAIIGTLKKLDRPIRPEDATGLSLSRHIRNITDEYRERFRNLLLELTLKKVKYTAETLLEPKINKLSICSISGGKQLENANTKLKKPLKLENLF